LVFHVIPKWDQFVCETPTQASSKAIAAKIENDDRRKRCCASVFLASGASFAQSALLD
jgi:hypothetical protein